MFEAVQPLPTAEFYAHGIMWFQLLLSHSALEKGKGSCHGNIELFERSRGFQGAVEWLTKSLDHLAEVFFPYVLDIS